MTRLSSLCALLGAAACSTPEVPEAPTYAQDVAPILAANCVRCHTVPASGGAPSTFRLDSYEDRVDDQGRVIRGAATMAGYMSIRVDDEDAPMPPRSDMYTHQVDILKQWVRNRDGEGRPQRGAQEDNQPPVMTVLDQSTTPDGMLRIQYEIRDPDLDIVLGTLTAQPPGGGEPVVVTRGLHSGRGELLWDVSAAAPGSYALEAALEDSSGTYTSEIATYDVADTGNRAPVVAILAPTMDAVLATAESETTEISVLVQDPDAGDDLRMTIEAYRKGDPPVTIASDEPVTAGAETRVTWRFADVTPDLAWHLRVTVSDGTVSRSVDSGAFIVSRGTTQDTFETIQDVLGLCVSCHPGARIPGLDFDLNNYRQQGDGPLGVYELRGRLYRRAVQERTMPPVSSNGPLGEAQLTRLGNWLLAGAPQ